jgi:copper chaperone
MSETRHVVLNVPNVSCSHCKMAIENAVSELAGVDKVEVDLDAKSVAVYLGDEGDLGTVKATIEDEGYPVVGEHEFAL